MSDRQSLDQLHKRLGYKLLNRTWAKLEILLGLTAFGIGILLGNWAISKVAVDFEWPAIAASLALIVLGGYLTLAGNRSHIYQSNNELIGYVVEQIHGSKNIEVAEHDTTH
jgi:hypothetical protein